MKSYRYLFLSVPVFFALAVLAALWFAAPQRTQAAGTLVAHWPLDESSGPTFSDVSGNGYDATCPGACPIAGVAGQENSALSFDGADDYLEVPYAASLNPGSFTVMAWANVSGGAGTYRSVITSRGDGYGYIIYATAANEWQFWMGHGSGWEYLGNTPVTEGEWTHLAAVYDGGSRDVNFYVNGEAAGSLSNRYLSPNPQWPLRIGAGVTESSPQFFFNGLIDDVRVYEGAMSQAEIQDVALRDLQTQDDAYTGRVNASLSVPAPGVLANDILTGSGPLTATLAVAPTYGDLALALDGGFVYTPTLDFIGTDVFTYTAHARDLAETAVVTLTIESNYPPVAVDDQYNTVRGVPYTAANSTLANDSDANGDALTASLDTGPAHGDLTFYADGSFVYTPTLTFVGDDTFAYRASDGELADTAVVTITVGANTPPLATDDAYIMASNTTLSVSAPGLLANDVDPDGLPLSASLITAPAQGTAVISPDGSFIYTPATDFLGQDSFTYLADDGVETAPAVVTITVEPFLCQAETSGDNISDYESMDATALQTAVDNAAPGALIRVAGTCAGVQARDGLSQTLVINQNLTIQGGYTASDWSLPPDPETYPTTLDAQWQGRVVYVSSGVTVTLDGLIITGGSSEGGEGAGDGGGIYNYGTLIMTDSIVTGNYASSFGGGILNEHVLAMSDSIISDNVAGSDGGGIENYGALALDGCTLSGNVSGDRGGGIDQWTGTLVVSNTTFTENDAYYFGGAIYANEPITLTNVIFTGNNASSGGGAIYFDDSDGGGSIANGLFVGNGEQHIGYTSGSVTARPRFVNCTFYGATSEAVRVDSFGSGPAIDFSNSIFWGNNGDITNNDAALSVQYSIVEESAYAAGVGNRNADPLFVDAAGGNLRLTQGSPAIDAGANGVLPAALTTDLDGLARIVAGTVDMGAYESQYEQQCSPSLTLGAHILGDVQPVTLDFTDLGDLACVTATYFPTSHPHATAPLQTGAFWTIGGEDAAGDPVTSGFTATLTLPFSGGDATTRACRWLEGMGPGAGWDCGESALTTYDAGNGQVSRAEVNEFSDWAAGSQVGPTAVTLHTLGAASPRRGAPLLLTLGVLLLTLGGLWAWQKRPCRPVPRL